MDFWDRRAAAYHAAPRDERFQRAIDRAVALLGPDDAVLDVGCGTGPAAKEIQPHVRAVHGIDTSAEMVRIANQEPGGCTFEQATTDAMPADRFTAAVAFNVLHLVDAEAMLSDLARILPPGGLLLTQTPCLGDERLAKRALIRAATKVMRLRGLRSLRSDDLQRLVERDFDLVERRDATQETWLVGRRR